VAGPLFTAVLLVQLRCEGLDIGHHPLSLLALGDAGWVQVANFVGCGLLALAFAAGVRRAIRPGRASTWGPILLGIYGAGLVAAGVFTADPALGFPPGTPDRIPDTFTFHGTVHAVMPPTAFTALIVACFVFARRFRGEGANAWAAYSMVTAVVALLLVIPVPQDGYSVRLATGIVIAWAWVAAVAARSRGNGRASRAVARATSRRRTAAEGAP
jgi:hypothetical membrane protein